MEGVGALVLAGAWYLGKYTVWGVVKGVEAISEAAAKT